jgi:hypothetical protein
MTVIDPIHRPSRPALGERISRYCDLCGEPAADSDHRPGAGTLHRRGVCPMFDLAARAEHAVPGAVVSSYRLLNHYAPVLVREAHGCFEGRIALELQVCLWLPDSAGGLRLAPAGTAFVREFPAADAMPQADPAIRSAPVGRYDLPPQWMNPRQSFEP